MPNFALTFLWVFFLNSVYNFQSAHGQKCSDGAPAVFPCNATRVDGQKIHVCALDLMLGCELLEDGLFYCCAQTIETTTMGTLQMLVDQMIMEEMQNNITGSSSEEKQMEDLLEAISLQDEFAIGTINMTNSTAAENIDGPVQSSSEAVDGMVELVVATTTMAPMTTKRSSPPPATAFMGRRAGNTRSTRMGANHTTTMPNSTMTSSTMASTVNATKMGMKQSSKRPVCIDIGPQCLLTAKLCQNPHYSRLVRLQCPRTCNLCTSDGQRIEDGDLLAKCMDRGKDCARAEFLCKTPAFSALMAVECAKTCGHCDASGEEQQSLAQASGVKTRKKKPDKTKPSPKSKEMVETPKCMDAYPRCYVWRLQGFCTSKNYSEFLKHRYCAETCQLCGKDIQKQ